MHLSMFCPTAPLSQIMVYVDLTEEGAPIVGNSITSKDASNTAMFLLQGDLIT